MRTRLKGIHGPPPSVSKLQAPKRHLRPLVNTRVCEKTPNAHRPHISVKNWRGNGNMPTDSLNDASRAPVPGSVPTHGPRSWGGNKEGNNEEDSGRAHLGQGWWRRHHSRAWLPGQCSPDAGAGARSLRLTQCFYSACAQRCFFSLCKEKDKCLF